MPKTDCNISKVKNLPVERQLNVMLKRLDRLEANSSSGSGGGGNMEARIAHLESDVTHIKTDISDIKTDTREIKKNARSDFRLTFSAMITGSILLLGAMAAGFGWLYSAIVAR